MTQIQLLNSQLDELLGCESPRAATPPMSPPSLKRDRTLIDLSEFSDAEDDRPVFNLPRKEPRFHAPKDPVLEVNPRSGAHDRRYLSRQLQPFQDCYPSFPFDANAKWSTRWVGDDQVYLNDLAYYKCKDGLLMPLLASMADESEQAKATGRRAQPEKKKCYKFGGKRVYPHIYLSVCPARSDFFALYCRLMHILFSLDPQRYVLYFARCHVDWVYFEANLQEIREAVIRWTEDNENAEEYLDGRADYFAMFFDGDQDNESNLLRVFYWEEGCFDHPELLGCPAFTVAEEVLNFPSCPPRETGKARYQPLSWSSIQNV